MAKSKAVAFDHATKHAADGSDELTGNLAATARVKVGKSGVGPYARREVRLIEGANVTITVTDQSASERVDVTIAAAGGGGTPSGSVVTETAYGQASAVGVSADYSRGDHSHGSPSLGTTSSTACAGDDARLSDKRTANAVYETAGPTTLTVGAVADGQYLVRSGSTIIGVTMLLIGLLGRSFAVEGRGITDVPNAVTTDVL